MGERSMNSEYTTVLDAGAIQLPTGPLIIVLSLPVLLLAFAYAAKARRWRSGSRPIQIILWLVYLSYAPTAIFQYWSLWSSRAEAREASQMSVEAGPLAAAVTDTYRDALFLETNQRFAVNGVDFEYRHLSLRYLDFLFPQSDLVALPLDHDAQVRVTYRHDGDRMQLLRFEIATSDAGAQN
jgi:hypothetical protein